MTSDAKQACILPWPRKMTEPCRTDSISSSEPGSSQSPWSLWPQGEWSLPDTAAVHSFTGLMREHQRTTPLVRSYHGSQTASTIPNGRMARLIYFTIQAQDGHPHQTKKQLLGNRWKAPLTIFLHSIATFYTLLRTWIPDTMLHPTLQSAHNRSSLSRKRPRIQLRVKPASPRTEQREGTRVKQMKSW